MQKISFLAACISFITSGLSQVPALVKDIYNYTNIGSITCAANFSRISTPV